VRSKADISQLNLLHDMLRSIGKQSGESVESVVNKQMSMLYKRTLTTSVLLVISVVTSSVMQGDYVNPQERRIDESFTDARAACTAQL